MGIIVGFNITSEIIPQCFFSLHFKSCFGFIDLHCIDNTVYRNHIFILKKEYHTDLDNMHCKNVCVYIYMYIYIYIYIIIQIFFLSVHKIAILKHVLQ